MSDVWDIMSHQLYFLANSFNVEIFAFVLMSNHFHLLMRTPDANLSSAMAWFMRETSRAITKSADRINQTWGNRHFRCVVGSPHYYLNAYKYIYLNPVKAGLCNRPEDYPYSTLHGLLGRSRLLIPIRNDSTLFNDIEGTLEWLNRAPAEKDWESVRAALRRATFKLRNDPDSKSPNHLETDAL